jgi:hypothetical protein
MRVRGHRRDELGDVWAAFLLPRVVVASTELAGPWLADTARHPARCGIEDQRTTLGDQDVDPELGANGGHQLGQQPRGQR